MDCRHCTATQLEVIVDDSVITVLSEEESWSLLSAETFGRLATAAAGEVEIFPINFVVDDRTVVFRTAPGTKLLELTVSPRVALEIDQTGDDEATSVVLKGRAVRIDAQQDIDAADLLPLRPWVPTLKYDFVRIVPEEITGRRFRLGPEPERGYV